MIWYAFRAFDEDLDQVPLGIYQGPFLVVQHKMGHKIQVCAAPKWVGSRVVFSTIFSDSELVNLYVPDKPSVACSEVPVLV